MFGINGGEALVLLLVAVIVVGPERLPHYAEQLAGWVRQLRVFMQEAKARVDEELGVDSSDVDWQALDPRRYDPRRIVREALLDDILPPSGAPRPTPPGRTYTSGLPDVAAGAASPPRAAAGAAAGAAIGPDADPAGPPGVAQQPAAPFDDEAT